jgi:hypothetical protein
MPTGDQNILKGQTSRLCILIFSGIGETKHCERGATCHFEDESSTTNPLMLQGHKFSPSFNVKPFHRRNLVGDY